MTRHPQLPARLSRASLLALVLAPGAGFAAERAFIGETPGLLPVKDKAFDERYARPGLTLGAYESVFIAPLSTLEGRDETLAKFDEEEVAFLLKDFDEQLRDKLPGARPLAAAPGKGVLVLEVAVTGLTPNRPDFTGAERFPARRSIIQVGGAAMQGVLKDGETGEVLMAFADGCEGFPFNSNLNLISVWGDAYDCFRDWSRDLAHTLATTGK